MLVAVAASRYVCYNSINKGDDFFPTFKLNTDHVITFVEIYTMFRGGPRSIHGYSLFS